MKEMHSYKKFFFSEESLECNCWYEREIVNALSYYAITKVNAQSNGAITFFCLVQFWQTQVACLKELSPQLKLLQLMLKLLHSDNCLPEKFIAPSQTTHELENQMLWRYLMLSARCEKYKGCFI